MSRIEKKSDKAAMPMGGTGARPQAPGMGTQAAGHHLRILVCDDEPHILHVVSTKLRNGGFDVVTAMDGEEALLAAAEFLPALILTDYQMPVLSGLELCARLRINPTLRCIPVVMLTARGYSLGAAELEQANIRKVLVKPFSPREVLKCVEEVLGTTRKPEAVAAGQ